jgi:hypothetical protein
MKTGTWMAILCSFAASWAFAQPCTDSPLPVLPQSATTADLVQLQLQNVSNYLYAGGVSVNPTDILIDVYVPGIPPPPGFPLGCQTLSTSVGPLPAGTYTVRWRLIPLPAAAMARAQPVPSQQIGTIIASATLTVSQVTPVTPVVQAVPVVNMAGLLLLACFLAAAGAFVLRR